MENENTIAFEHNILYLPTGTMEDFCGRVSNDKDEVERALKGSKRTVYLAGDVSLFSRTDNAYIVRDMAYNYKENDSRCIGLGQIPLSIHGLGVFFRNLFEEKTYNSLFDSITSEHEFQQLTESNKDSNALRTGIYLSPVHALEDGSLEFNLLRCSTNFEGPTEGFQNTDRYIVDRVNTACNSVFDKNVHLNHVLAQIYNLSETSKKARIKEHSDKTKDMPDDGLIVFSTFYSTLPSQSKHITQDGFDIKYKGSSVLSQLHFKLKDSVEVKNLVKEFTVPLYPNSVFVIPLSTNRLYKHEVKPSPFDKSIAPVRLGYIIRCSNVKAQCKDGETYINGQLKMDRNPSEESVEDLKRRYYYENQSHEKVQYNEINFSMNRGDYMEPILFDDK